jgi:predicted ATPase
VNLFAERAGSVVPRFSMSQPDEAAAVVEICRRLDGIPLAIELAASRMASMTASEVRDRLDQRFRLLVGSRRGLERHHTLRHASLGPTTCSTTRKRRCWIGVRCLPVDSICKAPAP